MKESSLLLLQIPALNMDVHREEQSFAPTAQMYQPAATSSNLRTANTNHGSTTPSSRSKSKGKGRAIDPPSPPYFRPEKIESADILAEIDRLERHRDLEDPDYSALDPSTSKARNGRKRKAAEPATVAESSTRAKKSKASRPRSHHVAYHKCALETQQRRDNSIKRIRDNWAVPSEQWFPEEMMPTLDKQPLPNPKDWNCPILEELAYLSSITRNEPERAYIAIQDSLSRPDRLAEGSQLLKTDIKYATERCEQEQPAPLVSSLITDAEVGHGHDEITSEPAALRSPTFADVEPNIKQEVQSSRPALDWSYEDDVEKLRECELRRDAKLAELEEFQQRMRVRQRMRERGGWEDHAIALQ